ncbi:MAG: DUF4421 domain-containing protein [Chitinophagaceae bacterium]|nr:DUF4421 domain-containing protein [Chitinophagaceae bacterium]
MIIFTLLWLAGMAVASPGPADSGRARRQADSSFIRSFYHQMDVGLQFGSQAMEYRTYYNDSFFLAIRPNDVYTVTPVFNYRWLSLSYAFTPGFFNLNNDDDLRGHTRFRRLSTSFTFNRWLAGAQWSNTRGFHVSNMQDVYPNWKPGEPYLQMPSLEVQRVQTHVLYKHNPNFSLKAIQGGEEQQLRSAWTWLPGINVSWFRFTTGDADTLPGNVTLTKNFDINLTLAAAGTWVLGKHFFLSGTAGPIVGVDFFNALAFDEEGQLRRASGTRFSRGAYLAVNLGYNHHKWYAGISSYSTSYRHSNASDQQFEKLFTQFTLYAGLRLKPTKGIKRALDWVENLLPILK